MFADRGEAGRKLAEKLTQEFAEQSLVKDSGLVLAIPRGGIVVGKEISQRLNLPLEVLITKKIPAPNNPELAVGAVGEGGVVYLDKELCRNLCLTKVFLKKIIAEKNKELELKKEFFRKDQPFLNLQGKRLILADDGVATGATILAAVRVVRKFKPKEIVVAIPVVALDTLTKLEQEADRVIYLEAPEMFFSVDQFYKNFDQVSDGQVIKILASR